MRFTITVLCFQLLFSGLLSAQEEVKKIELLNAESIDYDETTLGPEVKRLVGQVSFKHDNAILTCDSAYFNSVQNNAFMYSNVRINQGDTLQLFGDRIDYYGNTKLAKIRNNVRLVHTKAELLTDSMNYDRNTDVGYYFNYGTIKDAENTLVSEWGYYYTKDRDFFAVNKVVLTNPRYQMFSDTLRYNVPSETAFFYGPTRIISDTNMIYCENGWYNTRTEISQYNKNAYLKSKSQTLKGDSLYYDRNNGFGKAYMNVEFNDTTENFLLQGNKAIYYEEPQRSLLTDSAVFISIQDGDSLFMHADTLRSLTVTDSLGDYRQIKAYYGVRMYRSDVQGKCDSLCFSLRDSVMRLYYDPVLWSEAHQLLSDYIEMHTKNQKLDHINLINAAFVISQEDTIRFNQVKGKNMTGYFIDGELKKITVDGNAQSIYFPKDNNELIGINKAECSNMVLYLDSSKIERIHFITKPNATLYPLDDLSGNDLLLSQFRWFDMLRPSSKYDIFRKP